MQLSSFEYLLIASTLLEFNPLFQAIKSVRSKSVKDVSLYTFLFIFIIGSMWLYYGITINNLPLIVGNSIKLLTSFMVVFIYFKYRKNNSNV